MKERKKLWLKTKVVSFANRKEITCTFQISFPKSEIFSCHSKGDTPFPLTLFSYNIWIEKWSKSVRLKVKI